jgi:hypothetical protein
MKKNIVFWNNVLTAIDDVFNSLKKNLRDERGMSDDAIVNTYPYLDTVESFKEYLETKSEDFTDSVISSCVHGNADPCKLNEKRVKLVYGQVTIILETEKEMDEFEFGIGVCDVPVRNPYTDLKHLHPILKKAVFDNLIEIMTTPELLKSIGNNPRDFYHCLGCPAWYELLSDNAEDTIKVFDDAADIMLLPINELFRKAGVDFADFASSELVSTKTILDWYNGEVECTPYERLAIARRINLL